MIRDALCPVYCALVCYLSVLNQDFNTELSTKTEQHTCSIVSFVGVGGKVECQETSFATQILQTLYLKVPGYADMRAVWGHVVNLAYHNFQAGHHVLRGTEVSARGACMHASTGPPHT